MEALEALKTRRSIREYTDDTVSKEVITDIIDCGRLAATARNVQPLEFVVVSNSTMREQLAGLAEFGAFIADAPVCVVVLCQDTKYYLEDGSAATENILLAAHAHGLGSCWVAGDKKPYADEIRKLVGAPDNYRLISLIAIGSSASTPSPSKRPLDEVLHWEKF